MVVMKIWYSFIFIFNYPILCLKVQQRNLGVTGRIFTIETHRKGANKSALKLHVNFQKEVITLAKEVSVDIVSMMIFSFVLMLFFFCCCLH